MRNTFIIFMISGLWHGANWTFLAWGAYHALLFFPLMLMGVNRKYIGEVAVGKRLPSLKEAVQMLSTFAFVVIGWIIFRAENIVQARDYLSRMFSPSLFDINYAFSKKSFLYIAILIVVEWFQRNKAHGMQDISSIMILKHRPVRIAFYYLFIISIIVFAGKQESFIYFQF